MSLSRDELLARARADRLVLAMLSDDAEMLAVIRGEVGDDETVWWRVVLDLAWNAASTMASHLGYDAAICEAMNRIASQLDRAGA